MTATGEVACFGDSYAEALLKSMLAANFRIPKKNILVSLGGDEHKVKLLPALQKMHEMNYKLFGTLHTAEFLKENGIPCVLLYKISDKQEPSTISAVESGNIDLIINVPVKALARDSADGFDIRLKAVDLNIPLITNRQLAEGFMFALWEMRNDELDSKSWNEYR